MFALAGALAASGVSVFPSAFVTDLPAAPRDDTPNTWVSHGPAGGAVSIAVAPSAPDTVYAGTAEGKVSVTTDGALTWRFQGTIPFDTPNAHYALAVDPLSSSVLYAGVATGLFKSSDGGVSWVAKGSGLPSSPGIRDLAIDPAAPLKLLLTTEAGGVYGSTDGGDSWSVAMNGLPYAPETASSVGARVAYFAPAPRTSGLYYLGLAGTGSVPGLWQTVDGGLTWTKVNDRVSTQFGLGAPGSLLAVNSADPKHLYFAAWEQSRRAMYQSRDGGKSWTIEGTVSSQLDSLQFVSLFVHPLQPTVLYGGTIGLGLRISIDEGESWEDFSRGLSYETFWSLTPLAVNPSKPETLFRGAAGVGVYRLDTALGPFVGPVNGGPLTGTVIGPPVPFGTGALTPFSYNGGTYTIVNGKVTFPDCRMYWALGNPIATLSSAGVLSPCTATSGVPIITWETPSPMESGTALGSTQLNATANAPGTLTYSPPAGTVMTPGTVTLTATFTPTHPMRFTTSTSTVRLTVTDPGPSAGPSNGGPATGSLSGTTLTYNGRLYKIVDGRVTLPDCWTYIATTSGLLVPLRNASPCPNIVGVAVTWPTPSRVGLGTVLGDAQLNATASVPGIFVYDPPAGTVMKQPLGNILTVTFTPTDSVTYPSATASVVLAVDGETPYVHWSPRPTVVTVGTALTSAQLNAYAGAGSGNHPTSPAGTFVYTPPAGTVMNTVGPLTISATFIPDNPWYYAQVTASATLLVTASDAVSGFTPANGGGRSGTVSGHNLIYSGGTYPIIDGRVNLPGCTTYLVLPDGSLFGETATPGCRGSGLITPTVTWRTPAPVIEYTELSEKQMNAVADGVPGTFAYDPPIGRRLAPAGTWPLSVTFWPTDSAKYAPVKVSVPLLVTVNEWFAGRTNGGGWFGTVSGSTFIYNGLSYPIVNGQVSLPDCITYTLEGTKLGATKPTPNCTPQRGGVTTPMLTWATPAPAASGAKLSAAQCNASAGDVPGTFSYNPPPGTILSSYGERMVPLPLEVTFTPTDRAAYSQAKTWVTLVVMADLAGGRHPADVDADGRLSIAEVTAYAAAWKAGATWPNGSNPIPIGYVTTAGLLWRNGEQYTRGAGECPACWTSSRSSK